MTWIDGQQKTLRRGFFARQQALASRLYLTTTQLEGKVVVNGRVD